MVSSFKLDELEAKSLNSRLPKSMLMWYGMVTMRAIFLFVGVGIFLVQSVVSVSAQSQLGSERSQEIENAKEARELSLRRLEKDEGVKSQVDSVKAQQEIRKQEQLQKRCETATRVLGQYQTRFSSNSQGYVERFQQYHDRLGLISDRLSSELDVDTLQGHLVELQNKIDAFSAKQPEFLGQIQSMQSVSCEGADAEYKTSMQKAQNTFRAMRADAEQIRLFIKNTIRPELVSLRQQLASSNGQ